MGAWTVPVEGLATLSAVANRPHPGHLGFRGYRAAVRLDLDPSLDPAEYPFRHGLRVRFAETDAMGIVHHSRYLPYLEEARVEYLRDLGHPYSVLREEGIDFAVLEAFVQYRQPLRFDDRVMVHLHLGSATRATFQIAYLLTVDDEVRATAVTVHGCVNPDGRPVRMPKWLLELGGGAG
jgi:acyl-CoA thioester hydrolase